MPTDRELKVLLRPLLKRRLDLAYDRRVLFFSPLTHYLRGVVFINRMYSKSFYALSFVAPLFNGHCNLWFEGGKDQYSHEMPESWAHNRENASLELCEHLERYSLPPTEHVINPLEHEKSAQLMPRYPIPNSPIHASTVALGACFVGDFDRAERVTGDLLVHCPEYPVESATEECRFPKADFFVESLLWRTAYLARLLRTDRTRIPLLLHDWEAFTVNSLKLTKYWRPTPFPCETAVSEASPAGKPSHPH